MKVLVAYASRHGSTAGIAERIADRLRTNEIDAHATEVGKVGSLEGYVGFVVGSAAYVYRWLKEATKFVRRNRKTLAGSPLWLFSSGPVGTDLVDEKGRNIFEATRPKEFDELEESLRPRDTKVFFGAWDPDSEAKGLAERFMKLMPVAKASMPSGDFRDWDAIDAWADEIAQSLQDP